MKYNSELVRVESGWTIESIDSQSVTVFRYKPFQRQSYIELPME